MIHHVRAPLAENNTMEEYVPTGSFKWLSDLEHVPNGGIARPTGGKPGSRSSRGSGKMLTSLISV